MQHKIKTDTKSNERKTDGEGERKEKSYKNNNNNASLPKKIERASERTKHVKWAKG